jgi:PleD family two-component response regulator
MILSPILLVTNNRNDCELLNQSLTANGVTVHCIESSSDSDVVRFLDNALTNDYDRLSLIIVDLDDAHGYRMGLLAKIRQHQYSRKIPLLVISQNNDSFFVSHIYQLDATSVFKRPQNWNLFAQSLLDYWGHSAVRLPNEQTDVEPPQRRSNAQGNQLNYYPRSQSE